MANSFIQTAEDGSDSTQIPTDLPVEAQNSPNDHQLSTEPAEENYSAPPVEEYQESEHFLEEEEAAPEEEIIEDDAPALTPQAIIQPVAPVQAAPAQPIQPIPNHRDPLTLQIEKILEADLSDVFKELTQVQRQQFKIKGEETAHKIRSMISGTKVKLGKIIQLIFDWLKILPGINRFFLEQEAKIKADKIVALSSQEKHIS